MPKGADALAKRHLWTKGVDILLQRRFWSKGVITIRLHPLPLRYGADGKSHRNRTDTFVPKGADVAHKDSFGPKVLMWLITTPLGADLALCRY